MNEIVKPENGTEQEYANNSFSHTSIENEILNEIKFLKSVQCVHCKKVFPRESRLKQHLIAHSNLRPFKCTQCPKAFKEERCLEIHLKLHAGIQPVQCNDCGKYFKTKWNLKQHLITHKVIDQDNLRQFKCTLCSKSFKYANVLKNHSLIHSSRQKLRCNKCDKEFMAKGSLKQHLKIHRDKKQFKCEQCDRFFTRKSSLKRHVINHKIKQCKLCLKRFKKTNQLIQHKKAHMKQTVYIEDGIKQEPQIFNNEKFKSDWNKHVIRTDDEIDSKSNQLVELSHKQSPKAFKEARCNDCGKCYTIGKLKQSLITHNIMTQNNRRLFKCKKCDKDFNRSCILEQQLDIHRGKKSYKCEQCDRSFTWKSSLRRHVTLCLKRFKRVYEMTHKKKTIDNKDEPTSSFSDEIKVKEESESYDHSTQSLISSEHTTNQIITREDEVEIKQESTTTFKDIVFEVIKLEEKFKSECTDDS